MSRGTRAKFGGPTGIMHEDGMSYGETQYDGALVPYGVPPATTGRYHQHSAAPYGEFPIAEFSRSYFGFGDPQAQADFSKAPLNRITFDDIETSETIKASRVGAALHTPSQANKEATEAPEGKGKGKESLAEQKESDAEEEARLLSASNNFPALVGSSTTQPTYPRSIYPTTYQYSGGVAFPQHPNPGPGPSTRNQSSYSSTPSNTRTGSSGWQPAGARARNGADESLEISRIIQNRLLACVRIVQSSPGLAADIAARHHQILQEVSQLASSCITNLRMERDMAARETRAKNDKFMHAVHGERVLRDELNKLQEELSRVRSQERSAKADLEQRNARMEKLEREHAATTDSSKRFQAHHKKMAKEWAEMDDKHYKSFQELEGEIKALRKRNAELAAKTGEEPSDESIRRADFDSPSPPKSQWKPDSESPQRNKGPSTQKDKGPSAQENKGPSAQKDKKTPGHKKSLDPAIKAELIDMLMSRHSNKATAERKKKEKEEEEAAERKKKEKEEEAARAASFKPNPEAPAWNPGMQASASQSRLATESMAVGAGSRVPSTAGGPSNWPAVIPQSERRSERHPATPAPQKQVVVAEPITRKNLRWNLEDVYNSVEHLIEVAKGYVVKYHMKPGEEHKVLDHMLAVKEPATWAYLLQLTYGNPRQAEKHLSYLLKFEQYRPYIIVRMALDYLFKKIIAPTVFLGFERDLDNHLTALQKKIQEFTHPAQRSNVRDRQRVIDEHARIIEHALGKPSMEAWKAETIERHAHMLSLILHPLRSVSVSDEAALVPLRVMVGVTMDISSKVWVSGTTLHYTFPETGNLFSRGTMDSLNGDQIADSPEDLESIRARVSFVISPSLSVRDERDERNLLCTGVRKAQVLVMK
ncbi:hypothetical protein F4677DRAFT_440846 [Hypoxylon crocopeplum]|nr:hypothetical protein F4677DRAFT_440846 [Hypoxylon crocopeplum]